MLPFRFPATYHWLGNIMTVLPVNMEVETDLTNKLVLEERRNPPSTLMTRIQSGIPSCFWISTSVELFYQSENGDTSRLITLSKWWNCKFYIVRPMKMRIYAGRVNLYCQNGRFLKRQVSAIYDLWIRTLFWVVVSFIFFIFTPKIREDSHFDSYFSKRLVQPPTSFIWVSLLLWTWHTFDGHILQRGLDGLQWWKGLRILGISPRYSNQLIPERAGSDWMPGVLSKSMNLCYYNHFYHHHHHHHLLLLLLSLPSSYGGPPSPLQYPLCDFHFSHQYNNHDQHRPQHSVNIITIKTTVDGRNPAPVDR